MVVSVSLSVPKHRVGVFDWLLKQKPETVADALELTSTVYNMNKLKTIQTADHFTDCITEWENKYKNVLLKHQQELDVLNNKMKKDQEYLYKKAVDHQSELREIVESTRINCQKDYGNEICLLKQRNMELIESSQREKEYYVQQIEHIRKSKEDDKKQFIQMLNDTKKDRDKLQNDLTDLTKLFTGSASNTGIVGENLVHYTFNTLQLGFLDDMRYDTSPGCEDFLWTYDDMNCSVEVKNSKCLHSKHDMDKHAKRIQEAIQTKNINCGIFLSLNARVPNMSAIEIQTHFGIPVLYVSKHDSVSHQTIIELAFRLMHIIWKVKQNQNDDKQNIDNIGSYHAIFHDIADAFSIQIKNLSSIDDSIQLIEKNVQMVFAQIQKLKKNRSDIIHSIHSFYDKYPITKPVFDTFSNNTQDISLPQKNLMFAIVEFNARRKKYPKNIHQIKSYLDDPDDFHNLAKEFDAEFMAIVEFIKKNKKNIFTILRK